ncbi:hypothetical protein RND61_16100 [Streptomyces sp. TRM76323]|uniref:Uncharacterized protein n=1 Tax=Streptomyces tamarix TaxID=3078565 RepID=A0ABU3QMC4_9ACTN|nr:hypothetical protein [Streptomyces tamarix]MDT9683572.1 hypothetical protein [Streptomyces tamarix]
MTTPLTRRTADDADGQPYGRPSPGLMARAESGFEKFWERVGANDRQADEEPEQ